MEKSELIKAMETGTEVYIIVDVGVPWEDEYEPCSLFVTEVNERTAHLSKNPDGEGFITDISYFDEIYPSLEEAIKEIEEITGKEFKRMPELNEREKEFAMYYLNLLRNESIDEVRVSSLPKDRAERIMADYEICKSQMDKLIDFYQYRDLFVESTLKIKPEIAETFEEPFYPEDMMPNEEIFSYFDQQLDFMKNFNPEIKTRRVVKEGFVSRLGEFLKNEIPDLDIEKMEYVMDEYGNEDVNIHYTNGSAEAINVSMDSPYAMLKDIANHMTLFERMPRGMKEPSLKIVDFEEEEEAEMEDIR